MKNINEEKTGLEKKEWLTPTLTTLNFNETQGGPGSGTESSATFPNS